MLDEKLGGAALICGSLLTILTMTFHPSGHQLLAAQEHDLNRLVQLATAVHALAIAAMPLIFVGALALTRRIDQFAAMGTAALVAQGVAVVAGMSAAVISGFVAPGLARNLVEAAETGAPAESWTALMQFSWLLNQAWASVLLAASALAIALWSVAIVRRATLPRGLAILGLVLAPMMILVVVLGILRLDVHGFGILVLGQSVWLIAAGVLLACNPSRK